MYQVVGQWYDFYGGPGEAAHKVFVESAGQKTHRRVSKFAQQTAHQYYKWCYHHVQSRITECSSRLVQVGSIEVSNKGMIHSEPQENDDNVQVLLSGQYVIDVTQAVINEMQKEHTVTVAWLMENTDKNNNQDFLP